MDWARILVFREFFWHVLLGIDVTLKLFGNNIQLELHLHTNAGFTVFFFFFLQTSHHLDLKGKFVRY